MKSAFKVFILFVIVTFTCCNTKTPLERIDGFEYGTVTNNEYRNNFFNIKIDIPEDWYMDNPDHEVITAYDSEYAAPISKQSKAAHAILFTAYQKSPGSTSYFNPGIVLGTQNIEGDNIKSAKDYLEKVHKQLKGSESDQISINNETTDINIEPYEKKKINGLEFDSMRVSKIVDKVPVFTVHLATIKDDLVLTCVYSYSDSGQEAEIGKIINSFAPLNHSNK